MTEITDSLFEPDPSARLAFERGPFYGAVNRLSQANVIAPIGMRGGTEYALTVKFQDGDRYILNENCSLERKRKGKKTTFDFPDRVELIRFLINEKPGR